MALASVKGRIEVIPQLLKAGADVDLQNVRWPKPSLNQER